MTLVLDPAMPAGGKPLGAVARWVGVVDLEAVRGDLGVIALRGSDGYRIARLLVREHGDVRGYVTLPIVQGMVDAASLTDRASRLPSINGSLASTHAMPRYPRVTVVLCTRERPAMLRQALISLVGQDYPDFEVLVVDNAPVTDGTLAVTEELGVRYVLAPVPGLSRARNVGLQAADGDIIAFTDDDVIADPRWLLGISRAFAQNERVGCVTGLVPSGELRNWVQCYFDERVSWSKTTKRKVFFLSDPPQHLPMFPFCVGEFGTGANFAIRRENVRRVGLFDEALGVGTPSRGGEDLDMFLRVLFAGLGLVVEPNAIVWHRHRDDRSALLVQAVGYGRGLGAWLAKVAMNPRMCGAAILRSPVALIRLFKKPMNSVDDEDVLAAVSADTNPDDLSEAEARRIGRAELRQVLVGPFAYAWERLTQARGSGTS